jgi:hypothetical protein
MAVIKYLWGHGLGAASRETFSSSVRSNKQFRDWQALLKVNSAALPLNCYIPYP